jgi:hypothetical protein
MIKALSRTKSAGLLLFLQAMKEMRADQEIVKEYVIFAGEGYVKIQT